MFAVGLCSVREESWWGTQPYHTTLFHKTQTISTGEILQPPSENKVKNVYSQKMSICGTQQYHTTRIKSTGEILQLPPANKVNLLKFIHRKCLFCGTQQYHTTRIKSTGEILQLPPANKEKCLNFSKENVYLVGRHNHIKQSCFT